MWNTRFRRIHARCWSHPSLIEVSSVYQDARLTQDLEYLMTHEAAHFGVGFFGEVDASVFCLQGASCSKGYHVSDGWHVFCPRAWYAGWHTP
jgi:hypothetical protein